jgi:hypothetical protein
MKYMLIYRSEDQAERLRKAFASVNATIEQELHLNGSLPGAMIGSLTDDQRDTLRRNGLSPVDAPHHAKWV